MCVKEGLLNFQSCNDFTAGLPSLPEEGVT
jgi:hypothetical protein